jgi:hypothetical protein
VQDIVDWSVPSSVKELRSFLGLADYYRKFVKHFGVLARPLFDLLKKNVMFIWTEEHNFAFRALKTAKLTALMLALPDFSKPLDVETNASSNGVGAVLPQQGQPWLSSAKLWGPRTKAFALTKKCTFPYWRHRINGVTTYSVESLPYSQTKRV